MHELRTHTTIVYIQEGPQKCSLSEKRKKNTLLGPTLVFEMLFPLMASRSSPLLSDPL
jgi:hypothetical protein